MRTRAVRSATATTQTEAKPVRAPSSTHPLATLQRSAGNLAVQRAISTGSPLPRELRASLESYFKTPLDRVRLHTDDASQSLADSLGARAFTAGQHIHLGSDGARATGSELRKLVAHEVVHTLQQGQVGPRAKLKVGAPDDRFERQAERMSAQFERGGTAERVDHVGAPVIQRAMHPTHYGEFEDVHYDYLTDAAGTNVGVEMYMKFHPGPNAEADPIGLVQTAVGMVRGSPDTRGSRGLHQATSGMGVGRFVDRLPGYPNPLYATEASPRSGRDAENLADYPTVRVKELTPEQQAASPVRGKQYRGLGRHGYRRLEDGAFVTRPAELHDEPHFDAVPPASGQHFETAALALDGRDAGTYYGSVKWGWMTDASGALTKIPFQVVSAGVPSVSFLTAATIWNASQVDLAFVTTEAASFLDVTLDSLATIEAGTQLPPTGRQTTIGRTTYVEVRYSNRKGLVESTSLRPIAAGAQTLDLPVPMIQVVWNPFGATMLLDKTADAPSITLPFGTRVMTNHAKVTVASGPHTGTTGYVDETDLILERVGTR